MMAQTDFHTLSQLSKKLVLSRVGADGLVVRDAAAWDGNDGTVPEVGDQIDLDELREL